MTIKKEGAHAELNAAQEIIDSFLEKHPVFKDERGELVSYFSLVRGAVKEVEGVRHDEAKSGLGSIAKQKAIEIVRRHTNGLGLQHKEPLVKFMNNIWEIEYGRWEAINEEKAHN